MGFLDLPAELRIAIYELALPDVGSIMLSGQEVTPAMLQVNHQIRNEARSFYDPSAFVARIEDDNMGGLITWLNNRSRADNQAVSSLILECCASNASLAAMRSESTSGDILQLYIGLGDRIHGDMQSLLQAILAAGVGKDCIHVEALPPASEGDEMWERWSRDVQ